MGDPLMVRATNGVILTILLLFALMIGDEKLEPLAQSVPVDNAPPQKNAATKSQPRYETEASSPIDRQQFLASFKRQSRLGLSDCLSKWRRPPQSLIFSALMTQSGRLVSLSSSNHLPECVAKTVGAMEFPFVRLARSSQAIRWRVDW